jgi:hypothetical protein
MVTGFRVPDQMDGPTGRGGGRFDGMLVVLNGGSSVTRHWL